MGLWNWFFGDRQTKGFRKRDLELAAMENLWPMPRRSELFPVSDAQLDQDTAWVAEKRAWVQQQSNPAIREAYEGWLRWVEQGIERNREENRTHAHQTARDARWEGYMRERRSGEAVAKMIPAPPKP